jgi:hypothetical protein
MRHAPYPFANLFRAGGNGSGMMSLLNARRSDQAADGEYAPYLRDDGGAW